MGEEGKTIDNVNTVIRDSDLQRIQENPDMDLPFKNTMVRQSSLIHNASKASIGAERKSISINRNANNSPGAEVSAFNKQKILQTTQSQGFINQKTSSIDLINKGGPSSSDI